MYLPAIAITLTAALAMPAQASDIVFSAIQTREAAWAHHLAQGDIAAVAAMYEEQAWLIVPGAPTFKGRAAIHAAVSVLKKNTAHLTLQTTEVEAITNDYVIENGIAETVAVDAGSGPATRANYQVLWHRTSDGNWLIVRDMVSPM